MVQAAKRLLAGVVDGIQSPAYLIERRKYTRAHGSDTQRLRGDVERVGRTFKDVMMREHGKQETRSAC